METFSALLAFCAGNSPVTGNKVTRSFDVFFDLRMNNRLSKRSRRRWFETPYRAHYDVTVMTKPLNYECWSGRLLSLWKFWSMMTSWHGTAFRIIGHLRGESINGFSWHSGSNADLSCCHGCNREQTGKQTIEVLFIWDTMAFMRCHYNTRDVFNAANGTDYSCYDYIWLSVIDARLWIIG